MKSTSLMLLAILASSCQVNSKGQDEGNQNSRNLKEIAYYQEKDYQIFQEYGFAIKAPCLLEDVSNQVSGEFLLNYGGITEKDNPAKITFYQLAINRLPIGYKDMPADKLKSAIDSKIKDAMKNLRNCKSILFGYEKYQGYIGECTTKGYNQKGLMFSKDDYIICLTVISNDNLEEKFNSFTNSFKSIKDNVTQTSSMNDGTIKRGDKSKVDNVHLGKLYSNENFSIKYPATWQIVQDDSQVTNNTSISVQIMEKQKNDNDFRPNINIIVSKKKWSEPTSYLAKNTISQNKQIMNSYQLLEQSDNISISNCQGSLIDYTFNIQGYKLHGIQYILKKKDNTTFIITVTTDAAKHSKQKVISDALINSLKLK